MKSNEKSLKKGVTKNLTSTQKLFANAIDYDALEKALNDPEVVAILKKIKL